MSRACCAKTSNYGKLRLLYLGIEISAVCIRNTGGLYGNPYPYPSRTMRETENNFLQWTYLYFVVHVLFFHGPQRVIFCSRIGSFERLFVLQLPYLSLKSRYRQLAFPQIPRRFLLLFSCVLQVIFQLSDQNIFLCYTARTLFCVSVKRLCVPSERIDFFVSMGIRVQKLVMALTKKNG